MTDKRALSPTRFAGQRARAGRAERRVVGRAERRGAGADGVRRAERRRAARGGSYDVYVTI